MLISILNITKNIYKNTNYWVDDTIEDK